LTGQGRAQGEDVTPPEAFVAKGSPNMAKQTRVISHTNPRDSMKAGRLPGTAAGTRGRR
jgi:hypothetical protein